MIISSKDNKKIKTWRKYHQSKYRNQDQKCIVEGRHLIEEAYRGDCLEMIITTDNSLNIDFPITYVSQEVIDSLSTNISHNKMIGLCCYNKMKIKDNKRILILDDVQDPGNVGTMIRSAYSFGFDGVIASSKTCDFYNEKCIAASKGSIFQIPCYKVDLKKAINELQASGVQIVGTSLEEAVGLKELALSPKMALIVGNEGQGMNQDILKLCNQKIKIEMCNFESLNVGVAASICMYELTK